MYCKNCGKEIDDKAVICPNCGVATDNMGQYGNNGKVARASAAPTSNSRFTGGAFANAFIGWIAVFVSVITLGLACPAMICWKNRWVAKNTYVNGKQLVFDGKGHQLFGRFMLWLLLSVITFGIYYIVCMKVAVTKWEVKHTHFADSAETVDSEGNSLSKFDGRWYQLLGVNLLTGFVTVITLSFGAYWAHCYKERWFCKHKTIDGYELYFDGKAIQYFGKRVLWTFLTIITAGIYSFWLKVKSLKWTVSHTFAKGIEEFTSGNEVGEAAAVNAFGGGTETQKQTNGLAIAGVILPFVMPQFSIMGLILSIIGLVKSREMSGSGKGIAIAGIIVSIIVMIVFFTVILYFLVFNGTGLTGY